jgi:hypothetical protein
MTAPDSYGQARDHLECAVAGLKSAADALRAAAALLTQPIAGLDPGELQTHAGVTDANAAGVERLRQRVERLLAESEGSPRTSA